ncbi:hypothetical protein [Winogradskyella sp. A2]|uniref:hypothetical protein n=1 Tax=Winogradskyella sp. A2 TaxID=3366944 RepID=UPI00398C62EE
MKLTQYGNIYFINSKVIFNPKPVKPSIIEASFEFAYQMAFGSGHHRNHRTGGTEQRSVLDIFRNTFQGKIAEGLAFEVLAEQGILCEPIDYSIHGKGVWDDTDLAYCGTKINIKSTAHFSNLLLLETEDWDMDGTYKPNNNSEATSLYNYFILVRIKPSTISLFNNKVDKEVLKHEIDQQDWAYDIPGCCSLKTLKHIITNDYVLLQNSMLNGKTKMDAENYYIQTGSLKSIDLLIANLKSISV